MSGLFSKKVLLFLLVIGLVCIGIPCGIVLAQEDVVRIGIVSPVSGNYADHGMLERMGMQMAVEEFNAKGGVLGKKVEMVIEDSETNPSVAARKLRRLAEGEGIKFAMGGVSSSVAVAAGEVAEKYGVLFIATNQNSDTVTGKYAKRCVFRVPPNMAMALRALGPYIIEHVGKRWYFFTHDYEWGWSGTNWGRKVLKKYGGVEVGESKIPLGTRDFSSYILKARAAKPDAVVITVGGLDRAALIKQIYEFGLHRVTTIVHTLYDYEDAWAAAEANVGVHGIEWYWGINAPGVKEFVKKYQERFPAAPIPVPTQDTVNGYIAMRELLRAMERAGTTEKVTPVIKALEGWTIPEGESLRNGPTYIREWDHQFVCSYYIVRSKKPEEMKGRADLCEVIGWKPGSEIARTREENPVELGPYPQD